MTTIYRSSQMVKDGRNIRKDNQKGDMGQEKATSVGTWW